jgi:hypothetical protein
LRFLEQKIGKEKQINKMQLVIKIRFENPKLKNNSNKVIIIEIQIINKVTFFSEIILYKEISVQACS